VVVTVNGTPSNGMPFTVTQSVDTQPPTAPGNLAATAVSGSQINLNWAPSTDNVGVTGYRVEQCQGAGCTNFTEIAQVSAAPAGMGPLVVSGNPNYFKDASGTPLTLNGSHTWNNLQDWGTNGSLQTLDFNAFVNTLVTHGHNFTYLWYIELPKFCGFPTTAGTPPDFNVGPHPWQRTGPGTATDGAPKFDLTRYDQAYFDRLRTRVEALNNAGIYVGVYTFTAEWVGRYRCASDGYPFTAANNINGISDGGGTGSFTMSSPNAITAIQDAYVEKAIDTLNDFPNVLWMVSEEAPPNSTWWNDHQIAHIRAYEATKQYQHPIGYASPADYSTGDAVITNSDADWISPNANISPTTSCGSGTPGCKVNVNDSDHSYFGMWNDSAQNNRNFAWKNFTNGNQVAFMDPYVLNYTREGRNPCPSPTNGICSGPDARWNNFRANLGYIVRYSRKLNLANVTSRNSLCSTGQCLAQTPSVGAEYLVYAPNGGSFTVNLSAMSSARTLNVEWFNPSTGATTTATPIPAGASSRSFTPPFSGDAVLYLVDSAGHAGAAAAPQTSYSVTGLGPGTYRYQVRAIDAAGNAGPFSNVAGATIQTPDTTPPSAPSGLTATTPGTGQVGLSWTAATDNVAVTGYLVERCQGPGCASFAQVAAPAGTGTTFTDSGLASSTSYTYRVRATDAASNPGPYSNMSTVTTLQAPAGISLMQHTSKDAGSVTSSSLAFTSTNVAGNWVAVAVRAWPSAPSLTVTDARGNTYRKAVQLNETVDRMTLGIFYAENIAGGSNTVTVSGIPSGGTLRFAILEYSGVATAGSLDVTAASQGTSSAPTTGSATTTSNGDLVIGVISSANSRTYTESAGYVIEDRIPAVPSTKVIVEDRRQPTAGPVSAGASLNSSDTWGAVLAAFRVGASGPPPSTPSSMTLAKADMGGLTPESSRAGDQATIPPGPYSVTDLGTLGGSSAQAFDINEAAEVVGYATTAAAEGHAFLWRNGAMTDLGSGGGAQVQVQAINNAGQIAGRFASASNTTSHAVLWEHGATTDLTPGSPGPSTANGINDVGQIVGSTSTGAVFRWQNGVLTNLGDLGGGGSIGADINDAGHVVGSSYTTLIAGLAPRRHAFLWQDGVMTDLGVLPGDEESGAGAINNVGQIAGSSGHVDARTNEGISRAFLYAGGMMTALPVPSWESYAGDINDSGVVVGTMRAGTGGASSYHAYIYADGVVTNLNDLIPFGSGLHLASATAINNAGQIVGVAIDSRGDQRAFLLSPAW
jgi:probable HAF family extracellular repeat protein